MLHKLAMAGNSSVAKLAPMCSAAVRSAGKDVLHLRAPAYSRSLTGREAARSAKARLIRASAAAGEDLAERQTPTAQSSFLNLSVDDRVVVSLVLLPFRRCTLSSAMSAFVTLASEPQNMLLCRGG